MRDYLLTTSHEIGKAPWYRGMTYEEVITTRTQNSHLKQIEDPHEVLIECIREYEGNLKIDERKRLFYVLEDE